MIGRTSPRPARVGPAVCIVALLALAAAAPAAEIDDPAGNAFFEKNIRPVLVESCYQCHAGNRTEAGLRLDVPEALRAGGESGPAIEPGDPEASLLLAALRHESGLEMPPNDDRLPDHVIADFAAWIEMGAPDPREADAEKLAQAGAALWSLQPVEEPELPQVEAADWPRNAIDRFVLASLEREGLTPNADADRWTLVRRVYFDLTGLPPTPEEAEAFVQNDSPEALENLVDRLLASPQFGEKWARHWLDVARYAESSGREFNFTYPHAWPYRDYVIDAFNADKPYDQFIREQLAGDLIAAQMEELDWRRRDELHAATGFLAVGPKRHNAGRRDFTADVVDDQLDVTSQSMLAMTVSCARCHDHLYDPIPTSDYYAMAGIFRSTRVLDGTIDQRYSRHPTDPIPMGENGFAMHEAAEEHAAERAELDEQLESLQADLETAREEAEAAGDEATEEDKEATEEDADESAQPSPAARVADLEEQVEQLEQRIEEHEAATPERPVYTMGVEEQSDPEDARIAIGGDLRNRGDAVPRGFLTAIDVDVDAIPEDASGRLQLADWLAHPDNPLTARVMVNRVWSHLFGRGIVPTVDNFGVLGKDPSHPDLLDHLARRFMDEGWSVKQLVREIVLSRTYGLSTAYESTRFAADPENTLLWRMSPRRLQAEQLRDAMLAVAGELEITPAEGSPITPLGSQLARGIDQEKMTPPNRHRSIYQAVVRDYLPEVFQLFDFAAPSLVIGRRAETTVPSQALYLLNSDFALDRAEEVARRVLADDDLDTAEQVDLAYRLVLSRPVTTEERDEGVAFIEASAEADEADHATLQSWTALYQALMAGAEFRYLMDAPVYPDAEQTVSVRDDDE